MKVLRNKTYKNMIEKMEKQNDTISRMYNMIEEKNNTISILRDKLENPRSCVSHEGSDYCNVCKYSYERNEGNSLFPCYKTGCTLAVMCEDFEMK